MGTFVSIPMTCSRLTQKSKFLLHHKHLCWWSKNGSWSRLDTPNANDYSTTLLIISRLFFSFLIIKMTILNVIQIPQNLVRAPAVNSEVTSLTAKNYNAITLTLTLHSVCEDILFLNYFIPSNQATTHRRDL